MKKAMSGHGIVILVMVISFFATITGLIPLFLPSIGSEHFFSNKELVFLDRFIVSNLKNRFVSHQLRF
jgi:hypothetical protein